MPITTNLKNMKKIMSLYAIILIFIQSYGQIQKPTKWSFSQEKINDKEIFLVFEAKIEKGWHLYSPYNPAGGSLPLKFEFNKNDKFSLVGDILEVTKPKIVFDEIFNKDEFFYENIAILKQKIRVNSDKDFTITGTIEGQNCFEDGRCINFSEDFEFVIKVDASQNINQKITQNKINLIQTDTIAQKPDSSNTEIASIDTSKLVKKISYSPTGKTPILVVNDKFGSSGTHKSLFGFFLIAFLLGLTALFTPCVFPMIPMTVSFFLKDKDTKKGKINALLYGVNIVAIYTLPIAIIIIIAQLFGAGNSISGDFANFLSTHWLPNVLFFLIFLVFAASFFGAFEITLPHWLVNPVAQKSGRRKDFIGTFFMAFTLVLVSFSCTGPIVGTVLVESTQGGLITKPIVGMLGFSMGVALPFTIFAYFPNILQKLPKSGGWLNNVKVILGFIELALGLKFLSVADQTYHWGLLNREIYLALWIVIFTLMGFYILGKLKFAHDDDVQNIGIFRLFLAIITFSFVVYMIPGLWGAPLKELSGYLPPKTTQAFDLERLNSSNSKIGNICEKPLYSDQLHLPHGLVGYFDVYQALNCAKKLNKPIFVDFTGHGCVNCRKMEEYVWRDPRVLKILSEDYIILSLYVDDKVIQVPQNRWFISLADGKLKKELGKQNADIQIVNFNKNSQPLYALIDYQGNLLTSTLEYETNIEKFIRFLDEGKKNYKLLHPVK